MKAILPLIIVLGLLSVILLAVLIVLVVYFYCLVRNDKRRDKNPSSSYDRTADTLSISPRPGQISLSSQSASTGLGGGGASYLGHAHQQPESVRHVTISNHLAARMHSPPLPIGTTSSVTYGQGRTGSPLDGVQYQAAGTLRQQKSILKHGADPQKYVDLPTKQGMTAADTNYGSQRCDQNLLPPDDASDYEDIETATRGRCYSKQASLDCSLDHAPTSAAARNAKHGHIRSNGNIDDVYTKVIRRPSRDPVVLAMESLEGGESGVSLHID